jgi:hypothetical protein
MGPFREKTIIWPIFYFIRIRHIAKVIADFSLPRLSYFAERSKSLPGSRSVSLFKDNLKAID